LIVTWPSSHSTGIASTAVHAADHDSVLLPCLQVDKNHGLRRGGWSG
jgi:hypothetical protein